jgi:hypothetical protein
MYLEIIDPSFGTRELEMQSIRIGDPTQSFAVPAGYIRDDSFSLSVGTGSSCALSQTMDPIIVVTSGSHSGQTIATAIIGSGCSFTDATIYAGRSLAAMPLTSKGSSVFQLAVWDIGNPQYKNRVDTAQISLSTIDGAVTSHSVILLKF